MAAPVVEQVVESANATATLSHTVSLPTAVAGHLLLIVLDKGSSAASVDAHASLTELLDENLANGLYIAYRWMDGTEPASYTLTMTGTATRSAVLAYRISGAADPATQAPVLAAATATGTSATPDPPASATPPSSRDYLFIAVAGMAGEEADDDTWGNTPPASYTPSPPRQKSCGIAGTNLGGLILGAERALTTGAAENPGTFGVDVSAAWRAQTITVHPTNLVSGSGSPSLGAFTASAGGTVGVAGTGSPTMAVVAVSSAGTVEVRGSGSNALALTASGDGTVVTPGVNGTGSPSLPAFALAAEGDVAVNGTGSRALASLTESGSGAVVVAGTGAPVLTSPSAAGAGAVGVAGTGSMVLFSVTAAGTGTTGSAGINGSGSPPLPALSLSSAGAVQVAGAGASEFVVFATSASGTVLIPGIEPPAIRELLMVLLYMPGSVGLQAEIEPSQWRPLKGGRPVVVTKEQLKMFSHPQMPADLDDHALWTLTGDSTLTPA